MNLSPFLVKKLQYLSHITELTNPSKHTIISSEEKTSFLADLISLRNVVSIVPKDIAI